MKKILVFSLFTLLLITFGNTVSAEETVKLVNNNGLEIHKDEYDRLISLGFTEYDIENMNKEEFDLNKDLVGEVVSESVKYYEITEHDDEGMNSLQKSTANEGIELNKEEYQKRVKEAKEEKGDVSLNSSSDTGYTSYKTMTTSIIELSNGRYRVRNHVNWDVIPKTRSHDVIGAAINSSFFRPRNVSGTYYGKQFWTLTNTTWGKAYYGNATYNSSSSKWNKGGEGYGLKMNLKNDTHSAEKVTDLYMYMYYEVEKASSSGNPSYLDVYGRYGHAQKNVSVNYSFGITWGYPSISFSGVSSSSFSIQKNTHASIRL